jgi:hypothetical protein
MARERLPGDPQEAAARMMGVPGSRMAMTVERSEARRRERPDLTISADALTALRDNLGTWIATRISRRFTESGEAPQEVEVEVNVKLDGRDDPIHETVRFSVSLPDDAHRRAARRAT